MVVQTVWGLLLAPSPLAVYAPTDTEYAVSARKSVRTTSWRTQNPEHQPHGTGTLRTQLVRNHSRLTYWVACAHNVLCLMCEYLSVKFVILSLLFNSSQSQIYSRIVFRHRFPTTTKQDKKWEEEAKRLQKLWIFVVRRLHINIKI